MMRWPRIAALARRVIRRGAISSTLLPDYLEEALAAFGRSCEEFEEKHL
jgi:hypothetical protein